MGQHRIREMAALAPQQRRMPRALGTMIFYSTLTIVIRKNISSLYLLYTHRYLAVATSAAELPKLNYGLGAVFNAVDIAIY